jgi:hypothetical protein
VVRSTPETGKVRASPHMDGFRVWT